MVKHELESISPKFIETIRLRLAANKQVRRALPEWGRIHVDRQLPFLCVFRRPNQEDTFLAERFVMGEASYITASGNKRFRKGLSSMVSTIAETMKESFGSFLLVEVWILPDKPDTNEDADIVADANVDKVTDANSIDEAVFSIYLPRQHILSETIGVLKRSLGKIKVFQKTAQVNFIPVNKVAPPSLAPLLLPAQIRELGCHMMGIGIRPVYRNTMSGEVFPMVRRELQRGLVRAFRNSFFRFTNDHTTHSPPHYHSLGRWSVVKAVWEVDRQLTEICNSFDFLLQVTPNNNKAAWASFQRNKYKKAPTFLYRPLPIDPALSKRKLYQIPIERIEDPTLAQLFRDQQSELNRKLTMLQDRGTPKFMYGSLQLYGAIDASLMKVALEILANLSPRSRDESRGTTIDANIFAARAEEELVFFRQTFPDCQSQIVVRDDITGLMVSQGNLLIGKNLKISETRLEALIQHEVGTHVLTYLNGKSQPFKQLSTGLPGCEEMQEGLAVLAEYIVGGLTKPRMRMLAARVVAAYRLVQGATFSEVFAELNSAHGFARTTAFSIAMRTFRSGGLTKDAVYLRGLVKLLSYLKKGGDLEPLFVGKFALNQVPIIKELLWRKVLRTPPLRPRYLEDPKNAHRLSILKTGIEVEKLIQRRKL